MNILLPNLYSINPNSYTVYSLTRKHCETSNTT